jgi:hypothetical protein
MILFQFPVRLQGVVINQSTKTILSLRRIYVVTWGRCFPIILLLKSVEFIVSTDKILIT